MLPSVIWVSDELIGVGLDNDSTAVPVVPETVLETSVKDAPAMAEMAALGATAAMLKRVELYCSVKVPEVTPWPLLRAMGIPLPGTLLATLIVARPMDTPGVLE